MSNPKPIFSRSEMAELVQRYLKPGQYKAMRDIPVMYGIVKEYPDRAFWLNYQLGFQLNSLFWLLSENGKETLSTAWSLFHLNLKVETQVILGDKVGGDAKIDKKTKSVADLLS